MDILTTKKTIRIKGKIIDIFSPQVMGILNLTPDSFYDGGNMNSIDKILAKVESMLNEGAFIIDVGGCSTRPGADVIPVEEEIKRIEKPIKEIRSAFPECIISVDTFRSKVAEKAVNAGAEIVNDVMAGSFDPLLPDFISMNAIPYIIMHSSSIPKDMQQKTSYEDIVKDILVFFDNKINLFHKKGITDLIIDPGFGFGKSLEQNYLLLKSLSMFKIFGLPVLAGISRKSMIYNALNVNPDQALNGTTIINTLALVNGVTFLRVHDVKEAVETIKLVNLYLSQGV